MSQLLVQLSHIFKSFGLKPLLDDISLSIHRGDCFALIGENGTGKTTLLRLLSGLEPPDRGEINPITDLTLGFLPQVIVLKQSKMTVRQYIEEGPLKELEEKMNRSLDDPERLTEWARLHEEYEKRGGYQHEPLEKILHGLDFEMNLDIPIASLSSGQRVCVAMIKALIENPDLLLLDEPTNHLDLDAISWLQKTLRNRKGATVIVSHDRKFLNETCNHLIEIHNGKLTRYEGSYDFYLEEKKRLIEDQINAYEAQRMKRSELKQQIRSMTFSKRKASPPSDRNVMAYDRRGELHQKSTQHTLDKLKAQLNEIENNPLSHPKPKSITGLKFSSEPLFSKVAVEFEYISKSFENKLLFSNFCKLLSKGDRIILTGANGSGKTTLLRIAKGLLTPDAGTIRIAPSAKIAYLDQEVEMLPMKQTPIAYFENQFGLNEEALRRALHMAALGGDDLLKCHFGSLSIGQRKRLMLLSLILQKPNVLFLDEPTNHLDLLTIEALEEALLNFEGAILAISHDQTFINKIGTNIWKIDFS